MGIPGGANLLLAAGGVPTYELDQSLRFRGISSQYLRRTANTGTAATSGTISVWLKKAKDMPSGSEALTLFAGEGSGYLTLIDFPGTTQSSTGQLNIYTVAGGRKSSTAGFRDPSAWFHLVITMTSVNTSSGTATVYINGVQDSVLTGNQYAKFWGDGSAIPLTIGNYASAGAGSAFHGHMAEFHSVQNQTLGPTNFGEFNDDGVWVPKAVSGLTYGSNGFYLKFDPSATNGIGHDHSGNGNNFTATGFTTSGTGTDVMDDTPTNNFATLNAVDHSTQNVPTSFDEGNLQVTHRSGSGNYSLAVSTVAFDSDDSSGFYFESIATDYVGSSYQSVCLVDAAKTVQEFIGNAPVGSSTGSTFGIGFESTSGYLRNFGTTMSGWGPSTTTWITDGDIIMVFVKNNKVYFGKNGTWLQSANPSTESNPAITLSSTYKLKPGTAGRYSAKQSFNFGQRAFSYTPPSGAKTLRTANLPAPDITDGTQYFNAVKYTGNGSNGHAITGVGFQPDLVWGKCRSSTTDHYLVDAVRGVTKVLRSNLTSIEYTQTDSLVSFNSDGFTLDDDNSGGPSGNFNVSGRTYTAWNWLAGGSGSSNTSGSINSTVSANPTAGFSIVSYTGNGTSGSTVGHGLGVAPSLIITKGRSGSGSWPVYHSSQGAGKYAYLDTSGAFASSTGFYGGVEPTSAVYTIGNNARVNSNGNTYIAYCFAEVEGYSKAGTVIGNANANGPFAYLGFTPRFILYKRSSTTGYWHIWDASDRGYNPTSPFAASLAQTEATRSTYYLDMLSNGFKIRNTVSELNSNTATFVYFAWAERPFGGDGVSPATAR